MNIKLLRTVQQRLLAQSVDPRHCRFDMSTFGQCTSAPDAPVCHTAACIAGEAVLAAGIAKVRRGGGIRILPRYQKLYGSIETAARKVLGLSEVESYRLFSWPGHGSLSGTYTGPQWPDGMQQKYKAATTATDRALIGAQRIEEFIASKGRK